MRQLGVVAVVGGPTKAVISGSTTRLLAQSIYCQCAESALYMISLVQGLLQRFEPKAGGGLFGLGNLFGN